jgi:DtxR family transcriptional regulator, Mn-dependent transcriptional regulator
MTKSLEDYLEAIYFLRLQQKVVRVSEISRKLSVSNASVNNALKELAKLDYITHTKYGFIEMTDTGLEAGKKIANKHHLLKRFFEQILHVSEKNADKDACSIEHFISEESLTKLIDFMDEFDPHESCTNQELIQMSEEHKTVKPLDKIQAGKKVNIFKVACADCIRKRMLELGLFEKDSVDVVKNEKVGPLIVRIKGCNMILGRGICSKILVQENE